MRVVAHGLVDPEGPVVLPDGRVACVDSGGVSAVSPDGRVARLASVGGGPNGLAAAPDGTLLLANNGGIGRPDKVPGRVDRVMLGGGSTPLVDGLDAPNDI